MSQIYQIGIWDWKNQTALKHNLWRLNKVPQVAYTYLQRIGFHTHLAAQNIPKFGNKKYNIFFIYNIPQNFGVPYPKFGVFWGVWVGTCWVNVELCFSPFDVYVKEQICFQNTRLAFQLAGGYMISFHLAPRAVHSQTRGIAFWSTAPWTLRSFLNPWKSHSPSL